MAPLAFAAVSAGIGLYSASVSARNAKKEQERRNKAIKIQQAWMREEKKHARRIYEVQTYAKFHDEQSAAAMRIAAGSGLGGSSSATALINQMSNSLLLRDVKVDDIRFKQQIKSLDNEIQNAGLGLRDPSKVRDAKFWTGLGSAGASAFETYVSAGGFDESGGE